ncbi:3'5'-cyclic nucleotide phosphodiesterase family protein [Leishmania donovani]|uniref:3'5'-cyclic nucleotide phosphodiesterase family protein n=1 Tax=Leishmania donovani TaxID=5661 RepID=A0A504XVV5_LEIDO|nr:3'5'-cyclic nucleotide phosphodiesterase family protein [Leishmania donovani]
MPGRSGSEAGGVAPSAELGAPLSATGATSARSSSGRSHPLHPSASASFCFGDAVPTHGQHALANAGEVAHLGRGGGHSHVPTPNQSTPATETRSVQLLEHLQQLLQSNVPTAMLQQWVSAQLLQAKSPATLRHWGSRQVHASPVAVAHRDGPRRHPLDRVNVSSEPSFTPSTIGCVCNANSGSAPSALTSAVDGGAVALAPAMCSATSVVATVPSKADIEAPLSGPSLPFLAGSAVVPSVERGGPCSTVNDPLASGAGNDNDSAEAHQRCSGEGLRKTSRLRRQHSQCRSLRNQSSNAGFSSPTAPSSGVWPATGSCTGANMAPSTIILHSKSPSPAGSPTHRCIASALHSATKAAIHATTSQLVAAKQQNISLLLGERFSRHPQNLVRRVATPLVHVGSGSSGTSALSGATSGATFSQGRSRCERDFSADGDNSSLATANTVLERVEGPTGSLVAPQTRFPSLASAPLKVAEGGAAVAAAGFLARRAPLPSMAAAASASDPARKLPARRLSRAITPPSLLMTAMDVSKSGSSGVSSLQGNGTVSDDHSAVSNAPIPSEQPANAEAEAQLKLLLQRDRPSSTLSAVMAARPLTAATEAASGDAPEPVAATEVPDVISLIAVDTEGASVPCTPFREPSSHTNSSLLSGGDSHQLPRWWGGAAAHDGERYHLPHRGTILTLPAVNASATPFAWAQPPNMDSHAPGLETSLSQLAPLPSTVIQGTRQASVTPRRATSLVSNASSHLGCAGATRGHGAATLLDVAGQDSLSLHDDVPSFNSSHTAGMSSIGDGVNGNRLRRFSVLHLSRSSMNGGVDPMDGVMPSFILDDINGAQRRSGPRFLRSFCRHTPVRVTESVTREALRGLGVPFIAGIDQASVPTNVLKLMDAYRFTDSCAFYVAMCLNVFLRYGFVQRFGWNLQKLKRFFEVAATYFRGGNPFHNPVHAIDVVMAAHQWLNEGSTGAALSDDEAMTFLFTAMVQQLAHTGADNRLLGQLKHPYAMLCSYASPQQGATVALVMALLSRPELHFFPVPFLATAHTADASDATDPAVVKEWTTSRESQVYDMLADLIMATDERNHATLKQNIADTATRLLYPSQPGNFCLNCCAYITDAHVPDLLKAVLHFIDFAYLFRPYQVYLSGNVTYTAEVYRQSQREYQLLQRLQEQQLLRVLTDEADRERVGEEVLRRRSGAQSPGAPVSAPAVTFATALLAEQQPWRQGVAQASTMTSLQRSGDEAVVAADTPPPSRRVADMTLPSETTARRHSSMRPPLLALDGQLRQQATRMPLDEDASASNALDSATSTQPLKGLGRDIVLISLEDLCLPFLEQLSPYMPEAWVAASYQNHQRLMKSLPTPEKFDEIVNRLLGMGEETEAERLEEDIKKEGEAEDEEADWLAAECPFTLPWRLLRPMRPIEAEWTVDKDSLVRRVVREIMRGPDQLLKESDAS